MTRKNPPERRTLILYERDGCHLCEDLLECIEPWRARYGFAIDRVDVDADPALQARYGNDVPVLVDGDVEICRHFLDAVALERRFESA